MNSRHLSGTGLGPLSPTELPVVDLESGAPLARPQSPLAPAVQAGAAAALPARRR